MMGEVKTDHDRETFYAITNPHRQRAMDIIETVSETNNAREIRLLNLERYLIEEYDSAMSRLGNVSIAEPSPPFQTREGELHSKIRSTLRIGR
jgi:hypothetical protein